MNVKYVYRTPYQVFIKKFLAIYFKDKILPSIKTLINPVVIGLLLYGVYELFLYIGTILIMTIGLKIAISICLPLFLILLLIDNGVSPTDFN